MSIATVVNPDRAHAAKVSETLVAPPPRRGATPSVAQTAVDAPLARLGDAASSVSTTPDVTALVMRWAPIAISLIGAVIACGFYFIYWTLLVPR